VAVAAEQDGRLHGHESDEQGIEHPKRQRPLPPRHRAHGRGRQGIQTRREPHQVDASQRERQHHSEYHHPRDDVADVKGRHEIAGQVRERRVRRGEQPAEHQHEHHGDRDDGRGPARLREAHRVRNQIRRRSPHPAGHPRRKRPRQERGSEYRRPRAAAGQGAPTHHPGGCDAQHPQPLRR
jgi:hypothetical protein